MLLDRSLTPVPLYLYPFYPRKCDEKILLLNFPPPRLRHAGKKDIRYITAKEYILTTTIEKVHEPGEEKVSHIGQW